VGKIITLTKQEEDIIIYNYVTLNKGMRASGKEVGVSDKIVKKVLNKYQIPIKPTGGASRQRYFVNEKFFQQQSANLGYVLGMLGSDGCVANSKNMIYIELQRADKEILERINTAIGNTREVKDYETGRGYANSKLYFYSQVVKEELATYNIIPNKTYDSNYDFPYKLNAEFIPDYIRGLFDGDGSIKSTNPTITWQIDTSCYNIAQEICQYLRNKDINAQIQTLPKVNIDIYRVYAYNKENCQKIYNLLYYPNVNLYMIRKYSKFNKLLA